MGHVASTGEMKKVYTLLIVKYERKTPLERQGHRWEDDIKVHLKNRERRCGLDLFSS